MKKAVLFIYTACLFFQLPAQPLAPGESFVKKTAAEHYITTLAHDSMKGRATGTGGMYKAAEFIAAEMKAAGLKPLAGNDDFFQYYNLGTKKKSFIGVNVMGAVEGKSLKDEVVIFCAHYDHLGIGFNRRGDSIFNGANDNASGVTAVLLLAGQVKKLQPERTVLFIAFSGEEIGLRGSEEFVAAIEKPELIKAVINFDMIGRGKYAYITGYEYGNLPRLLNRELLDYDQAKYGTGYFKEAPGEKLKNYFFRSDNYPFAKRNIPAHTIMTTEDSDKHYHHLSDETETIDFNLVAEVAEAALIASTPILNGKLTPYRIRVQQRTFIRF